MVSVVLVSSHNLSLASSCLSSLSEAKNAAGQFGLELIIGAYDATRVQEMEKLAKQFVFTNFKVVTVSKDLSIPLNRNSLMQLTDSRSEWILFIDDDVELPRDFFIHFQQLLQRWPKADVFGGPNLTPVHQKGLAKASGDLLGSRLNFLCWQRYSRGHEGQRTSPRDFILCNLFVRTRIQPRFQSAFPVGEELVLVKDFIRRGHVCIYSPDLALYHFRRESMGQILAQMEKYGRGRGMTFKLHSMALLATLIPILILLSPLWVCGLITLKSSDTKASALNWVRLITLIPAFYSLGLAKGLWAQTPPATQPTAEPNHAK